MSNYDPISDSSQTERFPLQATGDYLTKKWWGECGTTVPGDPVITDKHDVCVVFHVLSKLMCVARVHDA